MLKGLLLAAAIAWPPHIDVSTGMDCHVVKTSKVQGDCEPDRNTPPGVLRVWRACGYVEWAGRGPDGRDIIAERDLYTGDSFEAAMKACRSFKKAFDKKRGVR